MPTGLVICFSGRIGSGKSSVTESLAAALGWRRAGFGDYLRQRIVQEGGDPTSRQALQDLGQRLVDTDPDQFCRDVIAGVGFRPSEDLLLDGIRHLDIYRRVERLVAPSQARLIHLAADDEHVRDRVARREDGAADLARAESHRVESDLSMSLPSIADVTIDANLPLTVVLDRCVDALQVFGVAEALIQSACKSIIST